VLALQGAVAGLFLVVMAVAIGIGVATHHPWLTETAEWGRAQLGGFVATTAGVFLAFWLEQRRRRRAGRARFGHFLRACHADLGQLQAQCGRLSPTLRPGQIILWPLEAPVLRALAASPELHEHGSYALTTVLPTLVTLLDSTRNAVSHSETHASLRARLEQLQGATRNAQTLIAQELRCYPSESFRTADDQAAIRAFTDAVRAVRVGSTAAAQDHGDVAP
jgi:hypothetical protein